MNTKQVQSKIETLYNEASKIAYDHVEKLARAFMEDHPEIQTFIMCMGGWAYYPFEDATYYDEDYEEEMTYPSNFGDDENDIIYHEELDSFLCEWNDVYKTTGSPLRLDRDRVSGELVKITDW